MRARLAAIDLDGTLLRSDLSVSDRTRAALAAATCAGIDLVPVTARSPRSVRTIAADAGIGGVAICANGATVYDLDAGAIVHHEPLPADVAHRIVLGLREHVPGSRSDGSSSCASGASPRTRPCATNRGLGGPRDRSRPVTCSPGVTR